jgi:hypothetical protein
MIGSIQWKRQFTMQGIVSPTIMFKVVGSHDLWILHALFRVARSINNVYVLNQFLLFTDVLKREVPNVNFIVNEHECN